MLRRRQSQSIDQKPIVGFLNILLEHTQTRRKMLDLASVYVAETLEAPDVVIESRAGEEVALYYRRYPETSVGDKHVCVVVANIDRDAFVITAYLTDRRKAGIVLWQK